MKLFWSVCLALCLASSSLAGEKCNKCPLPKTVEPVAQKLPLKSPVEVADYLQKISVTIKAKSAEGSGTVRNVDIDSDGEIETFVLTAAHVVKYLRKEKPVVTPGGEQRVRVSFDDCALVQEIRQKGRRVGERKFDAIVIRYDADEDMAVLEVRWTDFMKQSDYASAIFPKGDEIPPVGTELFHCGSPGGQAVGANSVTPGIIAQIGRTFTGEKGEYDQATVASLPGSSGGGIFNRDTGEYVGMLTMGLVGQDSFSYYIPYRRIKAWAERSDMAWLIDDTVSAPTRKDLDKMPVEENGFEHAGGNEDEPSEEGLFHPIRDTSAPKLAPAC